MPESTDEIAAAVYVIASAIDGAVDAALDAGDAGWEREARAALEALRDAGYRLIPPGCQHRFPPVAWPGDEWTCPACGVTYWADEQDDSETIRWRVITPGSGGRR